MKSRMSEIHWDKYFELLVVTEWNYVNLSD